MGEKVDFNMIVIIKGHSENICINKLTEVINTFHMNKKIDININGIEFKGKVSTVSYESSGIRGKYRIIHMVVETDEK